MDLENVQNVLSHSPSLRLLRLKQTGLILSFFFSVFKNDNLFAIGERVLINKLSDYLNFIDFNEEDEDYGITIYDEYEDKAKKLINKWTEINLLRNYQDDNGNIIYELTSHSEKTLQWFSSLEKKEFIGIYKSISLG